MIEVIAGILELDNKILIARRKKGNHLAGLWEFPGGKIKKNESPESCLKRELNEELGVNVIVGDFFMKNTHKYDDKTILLKSYKCKMKSGDITLNDHDKIEWTTISDITKFKFAPADIPFVTALVNEDKFIAFKFLFLREKSQRGITAKALEEGCELLSNSYFCVRSRNFRYKL